MENYILNRLKIDAKRALLLSKNESSIKHPGLKGRLRELLIDNLLIPWLPPYISCGTGTILSMDKIERVSTQDDIIVYDKSLVPPILESQHSPEGIFLFNSVIFRIEIKSTLSREDIKRFVLSSNDISKMKFWVQPGFKGNLPGPLNMLFAYESDAEGKKDINYQLKRIIDVMNENDSPTERGKISAVCIPGHGLWKIGKNEKSEIVWARLNSDNAVDHLTWFVGMISNTCYQEHAKRQGRDPALGVEGGIGMYIPSGPQVWQILDFK